MAGRNLDNPYNPPHGEPVHMSYHRSSPAWGLLLAFFITHPLPATDAPPPAITNVNASGTTLNLRFTPYPGAQAYTFFSAPEPDGPFTVNTNFQLSPYIKGYTTIIITNTPVLVTNLGYEWRLTNVTAPSGFYSLSTTPLSSNALLAGHVLNRLAYGPTLDELRRVGTLGAQAYINEQLNFEGIPDPLENAYVIQETNAIPSDAATNWTFISVTGRLSTTTFYLFTTAPGDMVIDDIQLRPYVYTNFSTTNVVNGTNQVVTSSAFSHIRANVLQNGDFESVLTPWTKSGGATGSHITNGVARSGSSSLHMVSTTGASSSSTNFVRQTFTNAEPATNQLAILSYWYLPSDQSSRLRLQLGSTFNSTPGGIPAPPKWVRGTATGTATGTSAIYVYLSGAGTCYVDDLKLVAGANPDVGPNLLANGNFESPLAGTWTATADFANSTLSTNLAFSGNSSLHLVATSGGGGSGDSAYQTIVPALANGGTYSVSYWYLPAAPGVNLTIRLSGSLLSSTPDLDFAGVSRRLEAGNGEANLAELRAWFCQRAVSSPRQLFEVMSQFWENHFVTQQTKSRDYIDGLGWDSTPASRLAADWEYREMMKWRNAMLNPNCTFYDLLKISVESPAMIVYLDTVNSRGDGNRIANENYARELLELFTFGVDNGYDQNDIVLISRAWTGWSVEILDHVNAENPFADASQTYYPGANSTSRSNKVGVLTFKYNPGNHGTNRGPIFAGRTVPARFGPPWAGRNYQLNIPARATGTTNSIQDGYDVIAHLADQPFTQEYISVKLCRLFVHDDFPNPTTTPGLPEYDFYDYTNPDRSAEADLVHQCMLAWENSSPKGNLRAVLSVIFNSDLFRSHTAIGQKVKTPFEFVASSVRALRATNATGGLTATTDGTSFATPLNRMGTMLLFDREAPDGYPETGEAWISGGSLVERIRYLQALLNSGTGDDAGNHTTDPVGLLKSTLPSGSWNNAGAVADFFLPLLYPTEGTGNLALYRAAAIDFLNSNDSGVSNASTQFNILLNTDATYNTRVRGMVAMLMTFKRFNEQ